MKEGKDGGRERERGREGEREREREEGEGGREGGREGEMEEWMEGMDGGDGVQKGREERDYSMHKRHSSKNNLCHPVQGTEHV